MKSAFTLSVAFVFAALFSFKQSTAQNSLLVNFGSNSCNSSIPFFSLIKNPLSPTPQAIASCDVSQQQANYFSVFIAYNPLNNRIYLADIKNGINTNIWVMDMGLPGTITCPASIPVAPTYSYNYVSNNFEFDNINYSSVLTNYLKL